MLFCVLSPLPLGALHPARQVRKIAPPPFISNYLWFSDQEDVVPFLDPPARELLIFLV